MSVESYLATVQRMIRWAIRDINNLIARTDMTNPDAARDALQAELPTLISVWGEAAATVAAEYFEELVDAPAVLADPVDESVVQGMVGWAVGPLYGELVPRLDENGEPVLDDSGEPVVDKVPPDPAKAARNLQGASQRHILDAGRNTMRESSNGHDGVFYIRVLQGEENCAFCVLLASRASYLFPEYRDNDDFGGSPYFSEKTAGGKSRGPNGELRGDRFHNFCDCAVLPVRTIADLPSGYDPRPLYEQYKGAWEPRAGIKTVTKNMRAMYGMH